MVCCVPCVAGEWRCGGKAVVVVPRWGGGVAVVCVAWKWWWEGMVIVVVTVAGGVTIMCWKGTVLCTHHVN